jgi:hypothetical protein
MSFRPKNEGPAIEEPVLDAEMQDVLKDFRLSVHATSDAAYNRPRTAVLAVRHRSWRLAAGWALGCVLVAGSASGLVYDRHHKQVVARQAEAARQAEQKRLLAQEQARLDQAREEEEDLLAKVDSDVSREVPSAMEPLAQLVAGDASK